MLVLELMCFETEWKLLEMSGGERSTKFRVRDVDRRVVDEEEVDVPQRATSQYKQLPNG